MPQQTILDFISAQGLGWFLAIVMLVPGAMLVVLLILLVTAKKYLGLDFKALQQNQRDEIEGELQLATEIRLLREKMTDMSEAMWGNRDYTDRKLREVTMSLDAQHKDILGRTEYIQRDLTLLLALAKKRKSDWIQEPNTEVFRVDQRKKHED